MCHFFKEKRGGASTSSSTVKVVKNPKGSLRRTDSLPHPSPKSPDIRSSSGTTRWRNLKPRPAFSLHTHRRPRRRQSWPPSTAAATGARVTGLEYIVQQGKTPRENERKRERGTPTLSRVTSQPKETTSAKGKGKKKKTSLPQPKPDGEEWNGTRDDTEIKADPRPASGRARAGVTAAICAHCVRLVMRVGGGRWG